MTVYEKDAGDGELVPVKAFVCSCGREGHETPLGTFKTSNYYQWRLMVDGSYGHYAVRFNKGIMFHSIPYYTKNAGNMEWEQFNLLGEPASLGCVRLTCADAKWIYDNCKAGTEVIVYDDAENPGPLGKPEEVKLTADNPMKKWDPTDTSSMNPWNQVRPTLYLTGGTGGDETLMLPVGASQHDIYNAIGLMDAAKGVYGSGEYIINVSGNYDLSRQGDIQHLCAWCRCVWRQDRKKYDIVRRVADKKYSMNWCNKQIEQRKCIPLLDLFCLFRKGVCHQIFIWNVLLKLPGFHEDILQECEAVLRVDEICLPCVLCLIARHDRGDRVKLCLRKLRFYNRCYFFGRMI